MAKIFRITFLFSLFLISVSVTGHKFYFTVTDIEFNSENSTFETSIRVFIDDLEYALQNKLHKDNLYLDGVDNGEFEKEINQYLKGKFSIDVSGSPLSLNYIGKEYDGDVVYLYIKSDSMPTVGEVKFSNKLFFEIYDSQEHIVKINVNDKKRSFLLTKNEPFKVLKIN
jgi:hypothetical protein